MKNILTKTVIVILAAASGVAFAGHPASRNFAVGDYIQTVRKTRVLAKPPTAGKYIGEQTPGAAGRIVDGPVRAADVWWWKVDFTSRADGWIMERTMTKGGAMPPPPPSSGGTVTSAPTATIFNLQPASGTSVATPSVVLRGKISHDIYPAWQIAASVNGTPVTLDPNGNFAVNVRLAPGSNDFTVRAITLNPRQQPTVISSYLDGSMIYGSDTTRAKALRAFAGGKLKTSDGNLPPLNTDGLDNANDAHIFPDNQLFLAGDVRANENIELTAIQVLFVREHNTLAAAIAAANPNLNDEQIYQAARRLVIAEVQAITYREFLPALLGPNAVRPYRGYNPDVNAGIANEFSAAAFRIGHTMVNDDVEFLDNDGEEIREGLSLAFAFFNPQPLKESGPDAILKYLATDSGQEIDTQLVEGLRNFLFGPPGAGGLDLASLNLQRGRDHGLPDYNSVRRGYGLPVVTSVTQITSDAAMQTKLLNLYGGLDSLDLWVTGLAEDHVRGSSVGTTFQRIIADQFERTRDGDRNWYQNTFSGRQLAAIEATRLSDIIRRNTTITKIQDNVFFFDPDATLASLVPKLGFVPRDFIMAQGPAMPPATFDGRGNNPQHPAWGSAGANLLRLTPAAYADGISAPAGTTRPSARAISNALCVQTTPFANERLLSSWVYGWGQFIDHDLDLTTTGDTAFDIAVPVGDASFDPFNSGTEVIPFSRSNVDATTGTSSPSVTQKIERIIYMPARR